MHTQFGNLHFWIAFNIMDPQVCIFWDTGKKGRAEEEKRLHSAMYTWLDSPLYQAYTYSPLSLFILHVKSQN